MNDITLDESLKSLLKSAVEHGASDVHLSAGQVPHVRIQGDLVPWQPAKAERLSNEQVKSMANSFLSAELHRQLDERGSVDGAFSLDAATRFRFNLFKSSDAWSLALRRLENHFRKLSELGLNEDLYKICNLKHGLILVAGPTGSGKSTTQAALIDYINQTQACRIVTIEDPIEYVHASRRSMVTQRQVGLDTPDFHRALVDAVRQDPDVILVGEIRDLPTIRTAITAAETGHLVLATVHAGDCVGAIERLSSVFPGDEQEMVRHQISATLRSIIAQHLLIGESPAGRRPGTEQRTQRVLASEVLHVTPAVSNLIAQANLKQIRSIIETSGAEGMYTLDQCLADLLGQQRISEVTARSLARNSKLLVERSRTYQGSVRPIAVSRQAR